MHTFQAQFSTTASGCSRTDAWRGAWDVSDRSLCDFHCDSSKSCRDLRSGRSPSGSAGSEALSIALRGAARQQDQCFGSVMPPILPSPPCCATASSPARQLPPGVESRARSMIRRAIVPFSSDMASRHVRRRRGFTRRTTRRRLTRPGSSSRTDTTAPAPASATANAGPASRRQS